jgi:hypothetical protein
MEYYMTWHITLIWDVIYYNNTRRGIFCDKRIEYYMTWHITLIWDVIYYDNTRRDLFCATHIEYYETRHMIRCATPTYNRRVWHIEYRTWHIILCVQDVTYYSRRHAFTRVGALVSFRIHYILHISHYTCVICNM